MISNAELARKVCARAVIADLSAEELAMVSQLAFSNKSQCQACVALCKDASDMPHMPGDNFRRPATATCDWRPCN
eukprot:786268-Amphidinium_carterae.1